ncbi:MAG: hypothetical protein ACRDYX_01630 [Egibacteraceae bacterium]
MGWADVATRRDLDALEKRLRAEMASMRHELVGLFQAELARVELARAVTAQTQTLMFTLLSAWTGMAALVFAIAHL